jgi:phosphate transport system substrate-binding protein
VKELGGSIGYVEFIYALQNHLTFGAVRNLRGQFVQANLESIAAAAKQAGGFRGNVPESILNSPDSGAYPIASYTWFVVREEGMDQSNRSAIASFLNWVFGPGQNQAAALGYVALPREVLIREREAIAGIH